MWFGNLHGWFWQVSSTRASVALMHIGSPFYSASASLRQAFQTNNQQLHFFEAGGSVIMTFSFNQSCEETEACRLTPHGVQQFPKFHASLKTCDGG